MLQFYEVFIDQMWKILEDCLERGRQKGGIIYLLGRDWCLWDEVLLAEDDVGKGGVGFEDFFVFLLHYCSRPELNN